MTAQTKKRGAVENGDGGIGLGLATFIANNEDLGPIVGHAFESGKPEALFHHLRSIVKKEVEIEELSRLHYEEFILAVDELRGVLVDADELKGSLSGENLRLQEVASTLLLKLDELLELYSVNKNLILHQYTGHTTFTYAFGLGEKFQAYYYNNRLMQLNLDIQISTTQPFLESHQHFLAQQMDFSLRARLRKCGKQLFLRSHLS